MTIPSTIQEGTYYNNDDSVIDYRGEGIPAGTGYQVSWETKNISFTTGEDEQVANGTGQGTASATISVEVPSARKFTTIKISKQ